MSWSLRLIGKKETVQKEAAERFAKGFTYLVGREAQLKDQAAAMVATALEGYQPEVGVDVECSGSGQEGIQQTIKISVQAVYGFVKD